MNPFWQALQRELGGTLAVEDRQHVLYGELPGCEFTLLGDARQVLGLKIDYSEGEDRDHLKARLRADVAMQDVLKSSGWKLGRETAFFGPEQMSWYLQPPGRDPIQVARATRGVAAFLAAGAPLRDSWCHGCGQVECALERRQGCTVRLCPECQRMLDDCDRKLASLPAAPAGYDRLDLGPLGLQHLSPAAQLGRAAQLQSELERDSGGYWFRAMLLAGAGSLILAGPGLVLAGLLLATAGVAVLQPTLSGEWLIALLLLGVVAMKLLSPPSGGPRVPPPTLERQDQPELFAWLDGLSQQVGAPQVSRVEVTNVLNAYAAEQRVRGRWQRTIGIGLPLFELLEQDELAAVVAHEMGHLRQRDWRATLIARTAWSWMALVTRLGWRPNLYTHFARWYLPSFWLYYRALSRLLERDADRASGAVASPESQARQLLRIQTLDRLQPEAWQEVVRNEARCEAPVDFDPLRAILAEVARLPAERVHEAYREVLLQPPDWLSLHPEMAQRLTDWGVAAPDQPDLGFSPAAPASGLLRAYSELRAQAIRDQTIDCQVQLAREHRFWRGRTARARRLHEHEAQAPTTAGQVLLGKLYGRLGRDQEASECLERALALAPANLTAVQELVHLHLTRHRPLAALEALDRHLPAHALDFNLLWAGARCGEQCGLPERAVHYYRRLLTMELSRVHREDIQNRMSKL